MKNEYEKMVTGDLYNPNDKKLMSDREKAKNLCYEYNQTLPSDKIKREEIIGNLIGKTGKTFTIEQNFQCDYGYNIEIGENFYSNHNLVILDPAPVKFGKNVFIGPNCGFYTPEHPIDGKERANMLEYAKPICVGDDVWIGGGVNVLSGVTIGNNVVIGAGSVVTKDIPSNSVAVGNPCRVIRQIC